MNLGQQTDPLLPRPPDDADDYTKELHRRLTEAFVAMSNRVDSHIPYSVDTTKVLVPDPTAQNGLAWGTTTGTGGGGGFLKGDQFTANGTWTAPTGVTGAWITMIGGGGSGSARIAAASGGGSGASGEFVSRFSIKVVAGTSYTVTIGAGGVGLAAGLVAATAGNPGGDTSFGPFYVRGGAGGTSGGTGGLGGGTRGGAGGVQAAPGVIGSLGTASTPNHFGGTGGSGGGSTVAANGGAGQGAGGFLTGGAAGVVASAQAGGGGGPATVYGIGGDGGNGGSAGSDAPAGSYGAGGGGAGGKVTTTAATGAGMSGYVLVQYVA